MKSRDSRHSILIFTNLMIALMLTIFFARSLNASTSAGDILPSNAVVKSSTIKKPFYKSPAINETAKLINDYRAENDLKPLNQSPDLDRIAEFRAQDMGKNSYYSHTDKAGNDFSSLTDDIYSNDQFACENLNLNDSLNPNYFVKSWIASKSGHSECILNSKITKAGYATTKVAALNGIEVDQYVIVAIYGE